MSQKSSTKPMNALSPVHEKVPRPQVYKVVEVSNVDELSLEKELNDWTANGWHLESVQFAMRESSRRPSMAFLFFVREHSVSNSELSVEVDAAASSSRRHLEQLASTTQGEDESI